MIYKRGKLYWFEFWYKGERIRRPTKQGNPNIARQIEGAYRKSLANGEVGIQERRIVPSLSAFKEKFMDVIRVERKEHPETIEFYEFKYTGLLRFPPLAQARLDHIDEELIAQFKAKMDREGYEESTINRHLATLKRALRLAASWKIIDRVPKIKLLTGENQREFVLARDREGEYLDACPEFLRNWSTLAIETGMRRKELQSLKWPDVHFEPVGNARCGYVHVRGTKSKYSKRNIPLTATAQMVLLRQRQISKCEYVFTLDTDTTKPASVSTMNHCHERVRDVLGFPREFVLHSLRHTFGTRLGENRTDVFAIQRLMGHSSITVSQRYVHPSPEIMENAILAQERASQEFSDNRAAVPTNFPTVEAARGERIQ
jgi:integrase